MKSEGADRQDRTPLHYAAADANLEEVKRLLSAGADPVGRDLAGWTALHFAAQSQSKDIVKLLIDAGASVDLQDRHGNTALFRAVFCYRGDGAIIKLLMAAGADPNIENQHGVSPISLARTIANNDVASHFASIADNE